MAPFKISELLGEIPFVRFRPDLHLYTGVIRIKYQLALWKKMITWKVKFFLVISFF